MNGYKKTKECKNCDYEHPVKYGRADLRCKDCGRDLTLELVIMYKEGIDPIKSIKYKNEKE